VREKKSKIWGGREREREWERDQHFFYSSTVMEEG
jgi:hypothetical protein